MSGHAILHAMDDMSEGSRGASVLEQSSFSVSFLEKIIKETGSRLGYGELKNEQMKAILSFVHFLYRYATQTTQHVSVVHGKNRE